VRFDAPAALNRTGADGLWQRPRERRTLAAADLLIPLGETAAAAAREVLADSAPPIVPVPVTVEDPPPGEPPARDIDAVAYAGFPHKRGLDLICAAWAEARPPDGRMLVAGVERERALRWLERCGVPEPPGVEWPGRLPRDEWLRAVQRGRVLVNASRWEDYGLVQLEALAAGTPLVTAPSPGPYEALAIARRLDPGLVAGSMDGAALAEALRAGLALDEPVRADYARRAREALAPYRSDAARRVVAEQVLPRLGLQRAGGAPG
jgi:glycosyltransferase involved in cell wall biosynthesis